VGSDRPGPAERLGPQALAGTPLSRPSRRPSDRQRRPWPSRRGGHRVVLVVATRGERGETPPGLLAPGDTLGQRVAITRVQANTTMGTCICVGPRGSKCTRGLQTSN
jgi:hypothetical protein